MALTPEEYLLICLAEECDEVGQRVSKALRFSCHEVQPGQPLNNAERIVEELRDLIAVAAILRAKGVIPEFYPTPAQVLEKDAKIGKFMAISLEHGVIQPAALSKDPHAEIREQIVERLRAVDHMSVEDCFVQSPLYSEAADRIEVLEKAIRNPWCPDACPLTGRPFFMWIDGEPTYGGPFDSYTIPTRNENGELSCRQYDHDEGGWKGWSVGVGLILKTAEDWIELEERIPQAADRTKVLEEALRRIAEGNLGDDAWQANYTRVREIARLALNPLEEK